MTSEVKQAALEPCPNPWCNSRKTVDCEIRAAEAPILMPSSSGAEWAVACPVCPLQTPYFDTEVEAIAAWNTRLTAQSGEGRSGAGEDALLEALADIFAAWDAHVEANDRTNAAVPPIDATRAERAVYDERYRSSEEAKREWYRAMHRFIENPAARAALNARQSGEGERE